MKSGPTAALGAQPNRTRGFYGGANAFQKNRHRTAMGVGTRDSPTLTGMTVDTLRVLYAGGAGRITIVDSSGNSKVIAAIPNGSLQLIEVATIHGDGITVAAANSYIGWDDNSTGRNAVLKFSVISTGLLGLGSAGTIGTFDGNLKLTNLTAVGTLAVTGATTCTGLLTANGGTNTAGLSLTETLGNEACPTFASAANWTVGAGWTVDAGDNNSAVHGTSPEGTLVPSTDLVSVIGTVYKVVITFSALGTGGLMTLILGGVTKTYTLVAGETSHTAYIKATAVTGLSVKVASATRCTISSISVKPVTVGGATGGGLIQHPSGESHLYADAAAKDAHRTAMGVGTGDSPTFDRVTTASRISFLEAFGTGNSAGKFTINANGYFVQNAAAIIWSSSNVYSGTADMSLSRVSASLCGIGTGAQGSIDGSMSFLNLTLGGTLAITGATTCTGLLTANGGIQSGTGAGELDVVSASGALLGVRTVEATSAAMSGATVTVGTNLIPAGSYVLGVTVRVMTLVACGDSTFKVGDGTDADAWGATIAVAAGTASTSANFNITAPAFYAAATNVVLTANGTAFTAGVVKVAVHYMQINGPAS